MTAGTCFFVMGEGETITDHHFSSYMSTVNHSQRLEKLEVAIHSLKNHVQAFSGTQHERMFLVQRGVSAEAREPNSAFPLAWIRRDSTGFWGGLFQSETPATRVQPHWPSPLSRTGSMVVITDDSASLELPALKQLFSPFHYPFRPLWLNTRQIQQLIWAP